MLPPKTVYSIVLANLNILMHVQQCSLVSVIVALKNGFIPATQS